MIMSLRHVRSTLLATLLLAATGGAALAQQGAAFPFQGFEIEKLREVYTYRRDKPETTIASAYFTPSRAGRIQSTDNKIACSNGDLPPIVEARPGGTNFLRLHYEPAPQEARFTCVETNKTWDVVYRTAVKVSGDIYTFAGEVRAARRDDAGWKSWATEEATLRVSGRTCTVTAFRREVVSEYPDRTRVTRATSLAPGATCRLYARP